MTDFPKLALSVRQPWAWAIVHGGKNVENRSAPAIRNMALGLALKSGQRFCIHASLGMTKDEYYHASHFMLDIGIECPPPADLMRGGIIGTTTYIATVLKHPSPWFFGPKGLLLADATPCPFVQCTGQLGLFDWRTAVIQGAGPDAPKKWMLPEADKGGHASAKQQELL